MGGFSFLFSEVDWGLQCLKIAILGAIENVEEF